MQRPLVGRSILIIEDEPLIRLDISGAFERAGAHVTAANTLTDALVCVENSALSAVVLDYALGDHDSTPLCGRLKARSIPFVVCSGFSKIEGACRAGAHLRKPVAPAVLVQTVVALLGAGQQKHRAQSR